MTRPLTKAEKRDPVRAAIFEVGYMFFGALFLADVCLAAYTNFPWPTAIMGGALLAMFVACIVEAKEAGR